MFRKNFLTLIICLFKLGILIIILNALFHYIYSAYLIFNRKDDSICQKLNFFVEDESYLNCIRKNNLKSVQLLTEHFDSSAEWYNLKKGNPFKGCPESRCFAFRYKPNSHKALERSDGVIVHVPNLYRLTWRNGYQRRSQQLWTFYTMESPRSSFCLRNFEITDLDNWFNLTSTVKSEYSYFWYDMKQLERYTSYQIAYQKYITFINII